MSSQFPSQGINAHRGFTIIELLTAMALMVLLLLVVSQIMNNTGAVTSSSRRHIDADAEARMIFDRMSRDFSRMVKQNDVDYLVVKKAGSDSIFFYSEAPGFSSAVSTDQTGVSLVGYRINGSFQLERLGKGLTWDGTDSMVFLTFANPRVSPTPAPAAGSTLSDAFASQVAANSTDADYHVLGENVFRLEICFLLKPRLQSSGTPLPAVYSNTPYDSRVNHTSLTGIGLQDVQAIVVTLAILDETSKKILPVNASLAGAASALPDPGDADLGATTPVLPAQRWRGIVESPSFSQSAGLPQAATGHVRVYQRVFELNTPNS